MHVKFIFSKQAMRIDKIFTVDLTCTTQGQINGEDIISFSIQFLENMNFKSIKVPIFLIYSEKATRFCELSTVALHRTNLQCRFCKKFWPFQNTYMNFTNFDLFSVKKYVKTIQLGYVRNVIIIVVIGNQRHPVCYPALLIYLITILPWSSLFL